MTKLPLPAVISSYLCTVTGGNMEMRAPIYENVAPTYLQPYQAVEVRIIKDHA